MTARPVEGQRVEIRDLVASYGAAPVLDGVSLEIEAGELLALLGPSGCGKTTLLRCIAGLETPVSGTIRLGEEEVTRGRGTPPERRGVGMVFQDGALFPHLSVLANVDYGMPRADRRGRRGRELLDLVGLADKADRLPGMLSGGEQQRVALARALARRPGVLLLDEPFSSLDTALRAQLRGEVRRLLQDVGVTAVLVTHDQHEALMFGERVAVLRAGRLEQVDTPTRLYRRPVSAWVAGFVGEANLLAGEHTAGVVSTALGNIPVAATSTPAERVGATVGDAVVVLCRPEELELRPGGEAVVGEVAYVGQESRFEVCLPGGETVVARAYGVPAHRPGDRVDVRYRGDGAPVWSASSDPVPA